MKSTRSMNKLLPRVARRLLLVQLLLLWQPCLWKQKHQAPHLTDPCQQDPPLILARSPLMDLCQQGQLLMDPCRQDQHLMDPCQQDPPLMDPCQQGLPLTDLCQQAQLSMDLCQQGQLSMDPY